MKRNFIYIAMTLMLLSGCLKHEMPDYNNKQQQIEDNALSVFGVLFDKEHDWCTTSSGELLVTGIPDGMDKVQVMVAVEETDSTTSMLTLNETNVDGQSSLSIAYDAPSNNLGVYVAFISGSSFKLVPVNGDTVDFNWKAKTRNTYEDYAIPDFTPLLSRTTVESYASQRGWLPGQVLYEPYDIRTHTMAAQDYSDEYKTIFRSVIFSYFKNGRQYNNLPLIKESGLYNEDMYPFTTGTEPIVVSPVYKSDKAKQYGNEVWNSDFYYYYYKESDAAGKDMVEFLNSLPKFKLIPFKYHFGETEDDVISKRSAYPVVYWGDNIEPGVTRGSFVFPEGYKIGFMVRATTEYKDNGKPRKQGELYGDGRLNNEINNYSECNFKSSKLGVDGPRMGWITVNDRMLLCCESGTDSDFNDIILEVEGGVKPIINIPEFEDNSYTFCFEDTELGDYDMNDVVIKAKRINDTTVEYQVVACGALDKLKIMGINGRVINDGTEVHQLFGLSGGYVNTESHNAEPVTERVTVNKSFKFLDEATQPYIYDITTGITVKLSKKGEDPHGIMIPYDFKYPKEKTCIKDAYSEFNNWGQNRVTSTYWYKHPNSLFVFE